MKIVVCMKHSILPESSYFGNVENALIPEDDLRYVLNEFDNYALQLAVNLKGAYGCDEIVAVSLGPERVKHVLYEAVALGADRAIHIDADLPIPADPFLVAAILHKVVQVEYADLILTGAQSVDDNTSITSTVLAALLDSVSIWNVCRVESLSKDKAVVHREKEQGVVEVVEIPLPAVLAVQTGIVPLQYAPFIKLRNAKKQGVTEISLESLGLDIESHRRWGYVKLYPKNVVKKSVVVQGDLPSKAKAFLKILREEVKLPI